MRVERIGAAALILGDCVDVLQEMVRGGSIAYSRDLPVNPADARGYGILAGDNPAPSRVQAVITDPPFADDAHIKQRRALTRGEAGGGKRQVELRPIDFAPLTDDVQRAVCEASAELCDGWFLAFCQQEQVAGWREAMETAGIGWRRAQVWIKPDGSPQFTGDRPGVGHESIATGWCGSGRSRWNGGGRHGVYTHSKHDPGMGHGGPSNWHPTQKPQRLMAELVSLFSQPGDVVLDPFMGSGSTGVACITLGRRFVGIEREARYFDIACERIRLAEAQGSLLPPAMTAQQQPLIGDAA